MFWIFIPAIYFYTALHGLDAESCTPRMRAMFTAWSWSSAMYFNLIIAPQASDC